LYDLEMAELKLRQAQADLRTQVRTYYFAVLVARENLKVTRAMAKLADEVAQVLFEQLKGGVVAPYEPLQLRVLALQSRGAVVQAHNRYLAAWKQLTSAMGLPGMPLIDLAGRVDSGIPLYQYDKLLAYVLTNHTDVLTAQVGEEKARQVLRL